MPAKKTLRLHFFAEKISNITNCKINSIQYYYFKLLNFKQCQGKSKSVLNVQNIWKSASKIWSGKVKKKKMLKWKMCQNPKIREAFKTKAVKHGAYYVT